MCAESPPSMPSFTEMNVLGLSLNSKISSEYHLLAKGVKLEMKYVG